jgi:hypothetical protein
MTVCAILSRDPVKKPMYWQDVMIQTFNCAEKKPAIFFGLPKSRAFLCPKRGSFAHGKTGHFNWHFIRKSSLFFHRSFVGERALAPTAVLFVICRVEFLNGAKWSP